MVDFITEVQEELRKDDYNRWLRVFGPYVIGLTVAVVAFVGFLEWQDAQADRRARVLSLDYTTASDLAIDDPDAAIAAFEALAADADSGYAGLAYMRAGNLALEGGDTQRAVRNLDLAASQFELDRHAHLARLKAAYILAGEGRYADSQSRLQGLGERGAPFEILARELAGYNALGLGDAVRAQREFTALSTGVGVLDSVAERSEQTLSLIGNAASVSDASPAETVSQEEDEQ